MRYYTIIILILILTTLLFADKKHSKTIPFESTIELAVDPFIQDIVNHISGDSILSYLQHLESLGLKNPGSTALENTRDWLYSKYQSYGYTDIVYHDFTYSSYTLQNIVVTKTGTTHPDVILIIDGHYDTIGGPGVNDNGSGVAVILEVARLLANIDCEYTIKFINFSAEEQGLIGSNAYVTNVAVPQNMNILLVFNIDEVGGIAGYVNNTITCERDEGYPTGNNAASASYTDTLATLTQEYSSLSTQIAHAYGSDYMPFEDAGYVITGYYETNESPYPHGSNDILANMDPVYVTEIAKGATASALYFARAQHGFLSLFHQVIAASQDTINPYPVIVKTLSSSGISDANCLYQVNGGGFNTVNMILTGMSGDTSVFESFIPAQSYNSVIDYYFDFENQDSIVMRLPDSLGTYFQFDVTSPTLINNESQIVGNYFLYPPSPNPFNPSTKITYELNEPAVVQLNVYKINGEKVSELTNRFHGSGKYSVEFNGSDYSSGIYVVEMKTNNIYLTRKVLLVK